MIVSDLEMTVPILIVALAEAVSRVVIVIG